MKLRFLWWALGRPFRKPYRSWDQLREIVAAAIAETNPPPLDSFQLSEAELVFFRARARSAVQKAAEATSQFSEYYPLPTENPLRYVLGLVGVVIGMALSAMTYLWVTDRTEPATYPLFGALTAVIIAALGWWAAAYVNHRNVVQQSTNNMIFARFSQAPFGEALFRFAKTFGPAPHPLVTSEWIQRLRRSEDDSERQGAAAAIYLLNYFEFLASGVLRGDLSAQVVRENFRGMVCYYHDKCWPLIWDQNKGDPTVMEHLIKLRTHFRKP